MRNSPYFRQGSNVIRTHRRRFDFWWVAALLILVLGAYAAGAVMDARVPVQGSYEAGLERGRHLERARWLGQVRRAYQQGLNDSAQAIANSEQGVAMKQACMALATTNNFIGAMP
jgi:hypothetical protein